MSPSKFCRVKTVVLPLPEKSSPFELGISINFLVCLRYLHWVKIPVREELCSSVYGSSTLPMEIHAPFTWCYLWVVTNQNQVWCAHPRVPPTGHL